MFDCGRVIATKFFSLQKKGKTMKMKYAVVAFMLFNITRTFSMQYYTGDITPDTITAYASPHLHYPQCLIDLVVFLEGLGPNCALACTKIVEINPKHLNDRIRFASGSFTLEEKKRMQAHMCELRCKECINGLKRLIEKFQD